MISVESDEIDHLNNYQIAVAQALGVSEEEIVPVKETGYQLLNGSKTTKDRDKILGLCIAAGLSIKQTERVLKMSGFSPLYSKVDRDAVILICMNKGLRSVIKVNEELDKRGMPMLNLKTT